MKNEIEKAIETLTNIYETLSYQSEVSNSTNRKTGIVNIPFNRINDTITAIKACNKQILKEAKENAVQGNCYGCPDCESLIVPCQKYCVNCGQALLWVHKNV
jgi:hypothetical protein